MSQPTVTRDPPSDGPHQSSWTMPAFSRSRLDALLAFNEQAWAISIGTFGRQVPRIGSWPPQGCDSLLPLLFIRFIFNIIDKQFQGTEELTFSLNSLDS